MRVAAVQLNVALADVPANLAMCESLARDAARAGAQGSHAEFLTTGAGFVPELAAVALAPDGAATDMLLRVGRDERVLIGGSFLCRDADEKSATRSSSPGEMGCWDVTTMTSRLCGRTRFTWVATMTG